MRSNTSPVCITNVNLYERRNLSPWMILPLVFSGSVTNCASQPAARISRATRSAALSTCCAPIAEVNAISPRPGSDASKKALGCSTRLRAVTARIFGKRSSVQTTMETVSKTSSAENQGAVKMRKKPSRSKRSVSGPRVGS